jgi:hypothetical protein
MPTQQCPDGLLSLLFVQLEAFAKQSIVWCLVTLEIRFVLSDPLVTTLVHVASFGVRTTQKVARMASAS